MFIKENLLKNRCPECGAELDWNSRRQLLVCGCGLTMTKEEFSGFIDELEEKKYHIPTMDENLSGLNRL